MFKSVSSLKVLLATTAVGAASMCVTHPLFASVIGTLGHGVAIVCRNADGIVSSHEHFPKGAVLLDLWLAETLPRAKYGGQPLEIVRNDSDWQLQVENLLEQIRQAAPGYYAVLRPIVEAIEPDFNNPLHILDIRQDRIEGADGFLAPADCNREQVVHDDSKMYGGLIITKSIWDALPQTDRAALVLHESIYRLFRQYLGIHSRTPDDIDHLVGEIFSRSWHDKILNWMNNFKALKRGPARICIIGSGKLDLKVILKRLGGFSPADFMDFDRNAFEYCTSVDLEAGYYYFEAISRNSGKGYPIDAKIIQFGVETEILRGPQKPNQFGAFDLNLNSFFVLQ